MTTTQKKEIVDNILELLIQLTEDGERKNTDRRQGGDADYQGECSTHQRTFRTHRPSACEAGQGEVRPHWRG